jgi:GTP cyclohydrolase I
MEKTDPVLGEQVRQHLLKVGLETPMVYDQVKAKSDKKIKTIAKHFTAIMEELGLDLTDDSLTDTPNRVAKMYVREIFHGLDYDNFPKCTRIENKMGQNNSFVLERNVNVQSNCEHHFVIIDGKATVAYIPRTTILGLSKLNRIVQFFSKRPQVQERLTEQIAETISFITGSPDVAVYIEGVHYCVKSRGIQDTTSSTMTLATRGAFAEEKSELRREFLNSARMK